MQRWSKHLKWVAPPAALAFLAALYFFSPEQYWVYPQCLFRQWTGLECAGCGSLRSVHRLLHGEFAAAFRFNPLLYFIVPVLAIWRRHLHKPAWLWSIAGALVLFTVWRNL